MDTEEIKPELDHQKLSGRLYRLTDELDVFNTELQGQLVVVKGYCEATIVVVITIDGKHWLLPDYMLFRFAQEVV